MDRWRDKVAIVTGASAGIGAAIAEQLVDAGVKVVGLARRVELIEKLSQLLSGRKGKLFAFKTDMTVESDILQAFQWIERNVGPISILINNAGISIKNTIINGNTSDWKKVLDTNVLGLTIASREAIRSMQANKIDGHIININSIAGHQVNHLPFQNVYPASKFAVTALTEALRFELVGMGSRIKVSSISPGLVETEIFAVNGLNEEDSVKALIESYPSLKSEDIAKAVIFVLGTPSHVQVSELTIKPVGEVV